ncbi:MAG: hypothetical protein AB7F86_03840 [Bdellovibrionales bacterium]
MRFNILWPLALSLIVSACDPGPNSNGEHLIGDKLKDVSALTAQGGGDQDQIGIFDSTVGRIHQFNLAGNFLVRSFPAQNPGLEHSVLYDQSGNYLIDLTTKSLSIFDKSGNENKNPIEMLGKPMSAAFRADLGILVIYDDLQSVGILKLNSNGEVQKARVFGSSFGSSVTISAGDVDSTGRLVLALSDGSMALVDIDASLTAGSWVKTTFATTMDNVRWLAPVRGSPDLAFVLQNEKLSVINVATQTVTDGPTIDNADVLFRSKSIDGHIMIRDATDKNKINMYYVNAGTITSQSLYFNSPAILNSRLDLTGDSWTLISATYDSRSVRRWRFSDLLTTTNETLPKEAKFEVNGNRVFALYPSKMGYAVHYNLTAKTSAELKHFNIPFIQ